MIIDNLKRVLLENQKTAPLYLRNLLKEQLQYYVLNFVYNTSPWGEILIFKGGSCLRMFFDLPRLSEDLDLDFINKIPFSVGGFSKDLKRYFSQTLRYEELEIKLSGNGNIIYLKFPLLDKLGLAKDRGETKILFLRIDLAEAVGKKYKTEFSLKSSYDFSFLVRRYSLEDLFAGKIAAILGREGRVKGRDYFDLAWFLEKKVTPTPGYLKELTPIGEKKKLVAEIEKRVDSLDLRILRDDLLPLFRESQFVENFVKNYKNTIRKMLYELR